MEGQKVTPERIAELNRKKMLLLKDDEVDSLDEDGHSKHDPYAALARE